jgi:hypothetical protein
MEYVLLNLSDFNNDWNKSVLNMSRNERLAARGAVPANQRSDSQASGSKKAQATPNAKDHSTSEASGS